MFKYIKTIHSHTVAETSSRSLYNDMDISAGTLCQISDGKLIHSNTPTKPFYLVIEEKKNGDGKLTVDCIRLLPGMILMATFDPEGLDLMVGDMCGFELDMNDHCTTISSGGSNAEIIDINGSTATLIIN